jgi:diguanylate cyclase (GGDEF)-like protein/PAS domain S-box-containing protein
MQDSETKHRQILDSIDDGYYEVDLTGNFIFFNDILPKFMGYAREELMGNNYRILMDDINASRVFQAYNQVYRTGVPARLVEWEITTKNGKPIYVQSSIFLIRDKKGKPVGFRGLTRDITEKKRAEERLLESEEKYRALVENLNDVICTLDAQGCFSYVSPSVERLTGYKAEEMTGQPLSKFVHPEDIPALFEWLKQALEEGLKTTELRVLTREDRMIYMRASFRALQDKGETPRGLTGILTDMTEQKLLQEELQALAITDQMTGLYNRRGFTTLAQQHLRSAGRTKMNMILFFCDLDYMKIINDALGHLYGDQALIDTSTILKKTFREADIIARIGGDEFAILSINTTDISPEFLLERLQNQFDLHNAEGNRPFQLHISIGYASFNPEDPCTLDELMNEADTAMYTQKKHKRI